MQKLKEVVGWVEEDPIYYLRLMCLGSIVVMVLIYANIGE